MSVILNRDGGDLARTRRLGLARFEAAVRKEVIRRGRPKPCMRIVRQLFAALADPAGVIAHRPGALERAGFLMDDWRQTHRRLADTETRMTTILDDLQLTELVTSITGLSPVGAAAILAETGDPRRFATGRALDCTPAWRRGRNCPAPSPAARNSPARAARPAAGRLAGGLGRAAREPGLCRPAGPPDQPWQNRLTATQAQAVIAAAILRLLHAVITTGQRWDPVIATHGTRTLTMTPIAA